MRAWERLNSTKLWGQVFHLAHSQLLLTLPRIENLGEFQVNLFSIKSCSF